jgi:flagellar hook-length control protein FliK
MATPINSNSSSKQTQSASTSSAELLSRLQAQAQGEPGAPGGFNAWMEKHALTPDTLQASAAPQASKTKSPDAPPRELSATAARLLEQALNRSRQQNLSATRQAEQTAAQAAATALRQNAAPKARAEGATDKVQDKERAAESPAEDDDVAPTKANGAQEESAIVSELTPPPEVKTDDVAAMMAWLASLTQGDAAHGKKAAPKAGGGQDPAGSSPSRTAALAADPRAEQATGETKPAGTAPTTDTPLWQAMRPTTLQMQMQTEGQPSFKDELASQAGRDPLGGLNAASGMRPAPGWPTADAQGVPHESATLQAPVGSDAFAQALSDQLTMWVKSVPDDGTMTAELHLNPAELGPIHVKISLEGSDAQVDFAAAAVETRQAIEASMNQLSTAMLEAGLTLKGGEVSAQTSQQGFQQAFDQGEPGGRGDGTGRPGERADSADATLAGRAVAAPRPGRAGGLDLYA